MNINRILIKSLSALYATSANNRLSILMYHRTLKKPNHYHSTMCDAVLNQHFKILAENFKVLSLEKAVELLYQNKLPKNAVVITFDDGYADNATVALPLLLKHQLTATFFILPDYFKGGMMFNDRVMLALEHLPNGCYELTEGIDYQFHLTDKASRLAEIIEIIKRIKHLPIEQRDLVSQNLFNLLTDKPKDNLMVTEQQVKLLHQKGMTIGGHTMTHPILAKLDLGEAEREISDCYNVLSELLKSPITTFAYPNGKKTLDYSNDHIELLKKAGYQIAVSTEAGPATTQNNQFELPRYGPWQTDAKRFIYSFIQSRRLL